MYGKMDAEDVLGECWCLRRVLGRGVALKPPSPLDFGSDSSSWCSSSIITTTPPKLLLRRASSSFFMVSCLCYWSGSTGMISPLSHPS
ncbi:hypothetical protein Hamer_G021397 [Homarus americanus]|uniref:Uncharacterized protein n=1 Tax=Homarus americanus TaxID=6706 RepID=A0A8J5JQX1_HOMAM|nr:hypothetical protein Hamer_G021397 [Homarus americanus]